MPDCPYWRRLRTTPWTEAFRRSWDDDGVVGNKVYPSYLLLFDRGLSKIGSLDDKRSVSKRDSWSYDPEAVFGQCAGQWVVCLTCHHSISLLERKIISFPSRISRFDRTGCWSKGDGNSTLHGDWGTKTPLAL